MKHALTGLLLAGASFAFVAATPAAAQVAGNPGDLHTPTVYTNEVRANAYGVTPGYGGPFGPLNALAAPISGPVSMVSGGVLSGLQRQADRPLRSLVKALLHERWRRPLGGADILALRENPPGPQRKLIFTSPLWFRVEDGAGGSLASELCPRTRQERNQSSSRTFQLSTWPRAASGRPADRLRPVVLLLRRATRDTGGCL